MAHVGIGWALARLRRPVAGTLRRRDSLLGWLIVDGYGFHEGYFRWRRYLDQREPPPNRLRGYERRAFDQGLGRSLWFVAGASVPRLAAFIGRLDPARHADLWSGAGLAAAYAGGVDRVALESLRGAAGPFAPTLAQGAAFAAKARERAGNPTPHTAEACVVLCEMSAEEAADLTDHALVGAVATGDEPRYECWRQLIQRHFASPALAT